MAGRSIIAVPVLFIPMLNVDSREEGNAYSKALSECPLRATFIYQNDENGEWFVNCTCS